MEKLKKHIHDDSNGLDYKQTKQRKRREVIYRV